MKKPDVPSLFQTEDQQKKYSQETIDEINKTPSEMIEEEATDKIETQQEIKNHELSDSQIKVKVLKEPFKEIPDEIEDETDIPAYLRKKYRIIDEKNI